MYKKNFIILKRLGCIAVLCLCVGMGYAQSTKVHLIRRGETISSIAQKYNITKEELIKANPKTKNFIYVGMELIIPELQMKTNEKSTTYVNQSQTEKRIIQHEHITEKINSVENKNIENKLKYDIFAGISFAGYTGDDIKNADMLVGINAGLVASYFFYDNFFLQTSVGIDTKGYKKSETLTSGQYWDDEHANYDSQMETRLKTYNLNIPVMAGYEFAINENMDCSIKAGPYLTYAIAGKKTTNGYITTYPDIHSSETEHIDSSQSINDLDGFKKISCGINVGASMRWSALVFSASFSRGLTKVFKDSEIYEKNFLLSVGYNF